METSSSERNTRGQLRAMSRALQELHRPLLEYQRRDYEKHFGRIGSDFYVLQLAAEDPQFAWLRDLSAEMIRIDEMVSGKEPVEPDEIHLTGTRLRYLLTPSADGNSFQSHYDRAMQTNPDIIMAHAAAMRSLPPARDIVLFRGEPIATDVANGESAATVTRVHHPGKLVPGHGDHGYRALAAVSEIVLPAGDDLPEISAANEDVIFRVAAGMARIERLDEEATVLDASNPAVVNAGTGFGYSLSIESTDAPLRMLQAWVRPSTLGGEPNLQRADIPPAQPGAWRTLVGPEDGDAPLHVRNNVQMSDIMLETGAQTVVPARDGWDVFFLVTEGSVEVDGVSFGEGTSGLVVRPDNLRVTAVETSQLVAFIIDPKARITRAGRTAR